MKRRLSVTNLSLESNLPNVSTRCHCPDDNWSIQSKHRQAELKLVTDNLLFIIPFDDVTVQSGVSLNFCLRWGHTCCINLSIPDMSMQVSWPSRIHSDYMSCLVLLFSLTVALDYNEN